MATTQNLHLPQFDGSDRIHHDDFNEAFDKIDTALATVPRIVLGSYVGNGAASRTIDLEARPKFVLVWAADTSHLGNDRWTYWGLATEYGVQKLSGYATVELANAGFTVYKGGDNNYSVNTNYNGTVYAYLALL